MVQTKGSAIHNVRVESITRLDPPSEYWRRYPLPESMREQVAGHRRQIEDILSGIDSRMLMIVGPCSIHDTEVGLDYARRLSSLASEVSERVLVLMRVYFEKPRTTVGWKGLINDPNLNGTYDVHEGMARARQFLLDVCGQGLPAATEFLEPFTPQYLGDVISWGAIGARTTESQPHRLMASGLSMPIGFKNGTGGSVDIAVDGIVAARSEHVFLGIDDDGYASVVKTTGNPGAHLVLRGGKRGPNYDSESVASVQGMMEARGLAPNVVVDCSHANSNKDHRQQASVFNSVIEQRAGNAGVVGLMLESNIREGSQSLGDPSALEYGVSITDACVGWEETEELVRAAYARLGAASRA